MPTHISLNPGTSPAVLKGRVPVTKNAAATLTDEEVFSGLVLLTAVAVLTLPPASANNAGADLYVSATAAGSLVCAAGFHGGGTGADTLMFVAYQGCHVYSDGTNWYVLGCGPGCTIV